MTSGTNDFGTLPILGLGLLAGIVVVIRVYARARYPHALVADTYYHLLAADEIRKNGGKLPERLSGFLWSAGYSYPPAFHKLLAWFDLPGRLRFEKYSALICDLVTLPFLAYATYSIANRLGFEVVDAARKSIIVVCAYVVSPILNAYLSGPRAVNGSGRTLGEAAYVSACCCLTVWLVGSGTVWLVVAVALLSTVPLISKFATQVIAVVSVCLSVVGYWEPLAVVAFSLLLGLVWSKGHLWVVLRGQVTHSAMYCSFLQHRFHGFEQTFHQMGQYLGELRAALYPNPLRCLSWFVRCRHNVHVALIHSFSLWVVVGALLANPSIARELWRVDAMRMVFVFGTAVVVGWITTSLPGMRFLGEGFRYLEYGQWVYWMLLALVSEYTCGYTAYIAGLLSVGFLVVHLEHVRAWHEAFIGSQAFFESLRLRHAGKAIHTLGGNFWECRWRAGVSLVFPDGNFDLSRIPRGEMEILYGRYPYPSQKGFVEVLQRYQVVGIAVPDYARSVIETNSLDGLDEEFRSGAWTFYRVGEARSAATA